MEGDSKCKRHNSSAEQGVSTARDTLGGGLGGEFTGQIDFKTNVIIASLICVVMAVIFDLLLVLLQALITPWRSEKAVTERRKGRFFEMFRRTAS